MTTDTYILNLRVKLARRAMRASRTTETVTAYNDAVRAYNLAASLRSDIARQKLSHIAGDMRAMTSPRGATEKESTRPNQNPEVDAIIRRLSSGL